MSLDLKVTRTPFIQNNVNDNVIPSLYWCKYRFDIDLEPGRAWLFGVNGPVYSSVVHALCLVMPNKAMACISINTTFLYRIDL